MDVTFNTHELSAYMNRERDRVPGNIWWKLESFFVFRIAGIRGGDDIKLYWGLLLLLVLMFGGVTLLSSGGSSQILGLTAILAGVLLFVVMTTATTKARRPAEWVDYSLNDYRHKYTLPIAMHNFIVAKRRNDPLAEFCLRALKQPGTQPQGLVLYQWREPGTIAEDKEYSYPVMVVNEQGNVVSDDRVRSALDILPAH